MNVDWLDLEGRGRLVVVLLGGGLMMIGTWVLFGWPGCLILLGYWLTRLPDQPGEQ